MSDNITSFEHGDSGADAPSPLSKPILEAVFQNADVSGLAVKSLINAVLMDSGDKPIGDVMSVIPELVHTETSSRGYRIDVEAMTDSGEIAIVEVQLRQFASMIERSLLYAEQALCGGAKRGMELSEVISAMPMVIAVNILGKTVRSAGGFHQIAEVAYREPPYERATDRFEIHNLELSKFRALGCVELNTPLQCWLAALCRSQDEKKALAEVVAMDNQLNAYYEHDPGFAQFVDRYGKVAALPELRKAYRLWQIDMIVEKLEEERIAAKEAERAAKHADELAKMEAALAAEREASAAKEAEIARLQALVDKRLV